MAAGLRALRAKRTRGAWCVPCSLLSCAVDAERLTPLFHTSQTQELDVALDVPLRVSLGESLTVRATAPIDLVGVGGEPAGHLRLSRLSYRLRPTLNTRLTVRLTSRRPCTSSDPDVDSLDFPTIHAGCSLWCGGRRCGVHVESSPRGCAHTHGRSRQRCVPPSSRLR